MIILNSCTSEIPFSMGEPEVVTTGFQFTEGPHWMEDGSLIFSDIPANKVYRWKPGTDSSTIFVDSSGNSNGIEALPNGEIVLAQHAGRVSRLTVEGSLEAIVTEYQGKRLNSPNDLAIRSDGTIYFTDPNFGVSEEDQELDICGVYKIGSDGKTELMFDGFALPNGITFSPQEDFLYVNDSETGEILRFEVQDNGDLGEGVSFANIGAFTELGGADGMITDLQGRLYTTGPNGLIVFNAAGEEVAKISFDQQITNVEWGGEDGAHLFVTAGADVFRIAVTK